MTIVTPFMRVTAMDFALRYHECHSTDTVTDEAVVATAEKFKEFLASNHEDSSVVSD